VERIEKESHETARPLSVQNEKKDNSMLKNKSHWTDIRRLGTLSIHRTGGLGGRGFLRNLWPKKRHTRENVDSAGLLRGSVWQTTRGKRGVVTEKGRLMNEKSGDRKRVT